MPVSYHMYYINRGSKYEQVFLAVTPKVEIATFKVKTIGQLQFFY